MQILVDNLRQDVETAGWSVDGEHHRLRRAKQKHKTAEVEPDIAHNGRGALRQEHGVGYILLQQGHQRTQNQGRIDRLDTELLANQEVGQHQQDGVHHQNHGGNRQRNPEQLFGNATDHDGKTGNGTDDQLARHQEIIDRNGCNQHSDGHNEKFHPELLGF